MRRQPDPILPRTLQDRLDRLGRDLTAGAVSSADLAAVIRSIARLDGRAIARLDAELRNRLGFHTSYGNVAPPLGRQAALRLLRDAPDLRLLMLFHGSGHVREAALRAFDGGLDGTFFLTAILYRLNDWVPQVRAAARDCAARVLPRTDGAVVAEAMLLLLDRIPHWYRWTQEPENRAVVDRAMTRPDMVARLPDVFRTARIGRMGTLLLRALAWPDLDARLSELACDAFLPSVRVVALRTLLTGRASWVVGYGHEWIDKRYGLRRRVPILAHRDLMQSVPPEPLLARGARDRSGVVRQIAAEGLILHRRSLANLDELVAVLAADRSAPVRERIAFIQKERAVLAASPTPR